MLKHWLLCSIRLDTWDKCQTPKRHFNSLRLSLGYTVEFVLADLFHGSFEMGSANTATSELE